MKFVRDLNAEMARVGNGFEDRLGSCGRTRVRDPRFGRRGKADQRTVTRSHASAQSWPECPLQAVASLPAAAQNLIVASMKPGRGSDTRFLEPVREDLLTALHPGFLSGSGAAFPGRGPGPEPQVFYYKE